MNYKIDTLTEIKRDDERCKYIRTVDSYLNILQAFIHDYEKTLTTTDKRKNAFEKMCSHIDCAKMYENILKNLIEENHE